MTSAAESAVAAEPTFAVASADACVFVERLTVALADRAGYHAGPWYEVTSAIVCWPCEDVVTLAIRSRVGWRLDGVGVSHDVTIDLEDLHVASKTGGKRLVDAVRARVREAAAGA